MLVINGKKIKKRYLFKIRGDFKEDIIYNTKLKL